MFMYEASLSGCMGRKATNHVRVTDETWQRLNSRKRPGESFDEVITRLLNETSSDPDPNQATAD
jgi:hypothetical protein